MYPTDFEAKTSHLTLAEDGAYNRLLRLMWMTPGCSLPDDNAWIMRRMRVGQEAFNDVVLVVINEFCTRENGRVSNAKLSRVFALSNDAHQKRVSAGSKGGKAKALNANDLKCSNAIAKPKQPEPEPEPYIKKEDTNVSLFPDKTSDAFSCFDAYNEVAERAGWPLVQRRSKKRESMAALRIKECGGFENWLVAIERAEKSAFLSGKSTGSTPATFDWLMNVSNFTKLMEGNYDNRNLNAKDSRADTTARAIAFAGSARRIPSADSF